MRRCWCWSGDFWRCDRRATYRSLRLRPRRWWPRAPRRIGRAWQRAPAVAVRMRIFWELAQEFGRQSASQHLAAALRRRRDDAGARRRLPGHGVSGARGGTEPAERSRHAAAMPRILTSDQWADYLIFRLYPQQRVFFDGRSDFFGAAIGSDYRKLLAGENSVARTAGPLPIRSGAIAARLGAEHGARARTGMAPGVSGFGGRTLRARPETVRVRTALRWRGSISATAFRRSVAMTPAFRDRIALGRGRAVWRIFGAAGCRTG